MRVAITLPSLDPGALVARQLDAVVRALAARVEVEVFVESTRLREGALPAPSFHYLRFDERNAHRAFDTALYTLGRDFLPYEPSYLLAGRFPGVAWILDPAMHHMLLGGMGLLGRWDAYIESLEATMPRLGARVGAAVAGGWGTRALYDHYDPLVRGMSRHHRMLAATAPIAAQMRRQGVDVDHVELPIGAGVLGAPLESADTPAVISIVSASSRWPQPLMSGIAQLLDKHPDLSIRYVTPEIIHQAVAGPAAARLALDGRIEWHLSPSQSQLLEVADAADILVSVAPEPVAYERALMYRALARGAVTLVAGAPHYDFLPRDIAPRLAPGRALGQAFSTTIDNLMDDAQLVQGLRRASKRWVRAGAGATSVATAVHEALACAQQYGAETIRRAETTWEVFRAGLRRSCMPSNVPEQARLLINGRLADAAPRVAGLVADRDG